MSNLTIAVTKCDNDATVIKIPDGVTSIGDEAFYKCISLTRITIPDSVTSIGNWAFRGCTGLTSIIIPCSVTSIGCGAFEDCTSLKSVSIPDSVKSIEDWVFCDCASLKDITIPNSVTSIGDWAFSGSGLKTIYGKVDSYAEEYANANGYEFVAISKGTCGENASWLLECESGVLTISGTGSISNASWQDYIDDIRSVVIKDGITSIGSWAFKNCNSLTSITIPDSVTSIEVWAFYECTGLASITIPDSVTSIGYRAFYKSGIKTIYGKAGSYAEEYAKRYGYNFEEV